MKLSCIICSYNPNPDWLREALLTANRVADEIVLVNNGSKDFPTLLSTHASKFLDLPSNIGWRDGCNLGIEQTTGDFVFLLDDDDALIVENGLALRKQLEEMDPELWPNVQSFPIRCHFQESKVGVNNTLWGSPFSPAAIYSYNHIPGMAWFKRSDWEMAGGLRFDTAGDWEFWVRLHALGCVFDWFPDPVIKHRVRPGSFSTTWTDEQMNETRKAIEALKMPPLPANVISLKPINPAPCNAA